MDLDLFWHPPIALRDGTRERLIYVCDRLEDIPDTAGVYVFGREFGSNIEPIYIGRATNLRQRVRQHIETNIRLMRSIEAAKSGRRVLVPGEWTGKRGQQADRVLKVIETALIKYALAEGFDLVNVHGTKTPVHELTMRGNRAATRLFSWIHEDRTALMLLAVTAGTRCYRTRL